MKPERRSGVHGASLESSETICRLSATLPSYESRQVYGPFHRLEAEFVQDEATVVRQLLSGEIWGKRARFDLAPKVRAYQGPLREGQRGVEFWSFQSPDHPFGPRAHWSSAGPYVTIDSINEIVRLKIAFVRITQGLLVVAQ